MAGIRPDRYVGQDDKTEGGIFTKILSPFGEKWKERIAKAHPMGRISSSDEIAYGVLYLTSKEASFVTGAELVIDDGFIAQ